MIEENDKFNEVVTDIIHKISSISYEDTDKQKLQTQLLMNFSRMCEDYPSYLHAMSVLREKEEEEEETTTYQKTR